MTPWLGDGRWIATNSEARAIVNGKKPYVPFVGTVDDSRPECADALNCTYNGPATFCTTETKKKFSNCPYPFIKGVGEPEDKRTVIKYCSNCKKQTVHEKISKKTDVNQCFKCLTCGYDRVEVGGFAYDLM
jgi:hypothetical protein